MSTPTFSSNYDPAKGIKDLEPLLKGNGGTWVLIESGKGVERSFKFKTFKKTWVCLSHSLPLIH
jgi:4a-hydroxytetrahydrobiopterin dehydratase